MTEQKNRRVVAAVHPGDAYYEDVLRTAHRLARGSPFAVLSIHPRPIEWVRDPARTPEQLTAEARRDATRKIDRDAARLGLSSFEVVVPLAQRADVSDDIIEQGRGLGATVLVVGTHGRKGLDAWVVGSVAEQVVRRAPCHVYVVRNRDESGAVPSS